MAVGGCADGGWRMADGSVAKLFPAIGHLPSAIGNMARCMRRLAILILLAYPASAATVTERVVTRANPKETYTLVLPNGYDASRKYPLLLIFDPRGQATSAANVFKEGADEFGWILISSNGTRSDESWEPNERAINALWPEISRYPVDRNRVYATGYSGTAMAAWQLGIQLKGLAGVIAVCGRLVDEAPPKDFNFANYGFSGVRDFNNREMRAVDDLLEQLGKPHRFQSFDGGHDWPPPALARDAFGWFELIAMKEKRRPVDETLVAKLYARDLASAKTPRDYRAIVETYDGLRDVAEPRAMLQKLERDPAVQRAKQEEEKWDAFEAEYFRDHIARIPQIFAMLRQRDVAHAPASLMREFQIEEMKKRAAKPGAEGAAARRILEAVYGQMAFYVARQFIERGEKDWAAAVQKVAREIFPDR